MWSTHAADGNPKNPVWLSPYIEVVDMTSVQCLVGRVKDRKKWAIVDRSTTRSMTQIRNEYQLRVNNVFICTLRLKFTRLVKFTR